MPNATRSMSSGDSYSGGGSSSGGVATAPAPAPAVARTISFGSAGPSERQPGLPPAVALAIEPKVERAISLELADVVAELPPGTVRALEAGDAGRRVLLKASEVEKGMARGKPTVSLVTIFQQVPEIFTRNVPPSDTTQVTLPFQKVLEQFSNLQVRSDQHQAPAVPQFETPFLKVTLEDDSKFGTTTQVLQTADTPSVRLEPATAETLAAAEPEARPVGRVAVPVTPTTPIPLRVTLPNEQNGNGSNGHAGTGNGNGNGSNGHATEPRIAPVEPAAPARIPFKLTPNGTGVPATERVPASSEPPVPTTPPAPAAAAPAAAPTRIPFRISAPAKEESAATKGEPWLTKESFAGGSDAAPAVEAPARRPKLEVVKPAALTVALALKPILQSLPPFQVSGNVDGVPKDARIELPFALLEPQLASGRIVVKPEDFARALPAEYRELFNADEAAATVSLPLQEVLKNLPTTSLRMRDDQVEQEKGEDFATPFSAKAEEDAKRFNVAGKPVPKPVVLPPPVAVAAAPVVEPTPAPVVAVVEATPAPAKPIPFKLVPDAPKAEEKRAADAAPAGRTPLQEALDTDDELDAKAVIARIGKMAGVTACALMFGDGLSLAGNLPEEYEADGLCAMAPALLQRVENHMVETKLGSLRAMTLACSNASISFFMHDNLCLAALHSKEGLASDVRERLARAVSEALEKIFQPS
jgi:predicted regulator of Ras-like GTPase activity (Roadblock/LC7/MglB family)